VNNRQPRKSSGYRWEKLGKKDTGRMICFTVQFFELEIYISITTEMEEIGQAVASFF